MEVQCYVSLHFPSNRWCCVSFHVLFPFLYLLEWSVFSNLLPIFWLSCSATFCEYWITYSDCKSFNEICILQKKFFTALWLKSVFNRTEVFILNGAHSFFNWIVFVSFSEMSWLYYKVSSLGVFILFCWSICLYVHQYHFVSVILAL